MPERSSTGGTIAPAACVIGVIARKRGSRGQSHSASSVIVIVTRTRCVDITPFGRPEVPPV
ncbi:MAG TPA: hypothetical protein PKC20_11810 [Burkholderiaceae bacterium]|nr:hypothetical protein [Burkholderiaceae bacterium]